MHRYVCNSLFLCCFFTVSKEEQTESRSLKKKISLFVKKNLCLRTTPPQKEKDGDLFFQQHNKQGSKKKRKEAHSQKKKKKKEKNKPKKKRKISAANASEEQKRKREREEMR